MNLRAPDPGDGDALLGEGRALRALARSLLGGGPDASARDGGRGGAGAAAGDAADDVVQGSYAAALQRPDAARRLGPWLAGTVRRLAARWRRDAARRGS